MFAVDVDEPPVTATVEQITAEGGAAHPWVADVADPAAPSILFFHGNGEIVADYDDLGPLYNRMGINFLAADYRGYGRSTGRPTTFE